MAVVRNVHHSCLVISKWVLLKVCPNILNAKTIHTWLFYLIHFCFEDILSSKNPEQCGVPGPNVFRSLLLDGLRRGFSLWWSECVPAPLKWHSRVADSGQTCKSPLSLNPISCLTPGRISSRQVSDKFPGCFRQTHLLLSSPVEHIELSEMKPRLQNHIELHVVIAISVKDLLGKAERRDLKR